MTTGSVWQLNWRTPLALVAGVVSHPKGDEAQSGRRQQQGFDVTRLQTRLLFKPFLNMKLELGLSVEKEMNSVLHCCQKILTSISHSSFLLKLFQSGRHRLTDIVLVANMRKHYFCV